MIHLAKAFSLLFHPLVMPLYAMLLMLFATPLGWMLNDRVILLLLAIVFFFTCFLPFTFVLLLRNMGSISSLAMYDRKERIAPLLFGAVMCYSCYVTLEKIVRLHPLFPQLFFILTALLLLLAIITRFWKVSLHMAAVGGLCAIVFIFSKYSWLLLTVILLSGVLGTARLLLKAHNSLQVYTGFLLGLILFLFFFSS